jgi:hypothetical protein
MAFSVITNTNKMAHKIFEHKGKKYIRKYAKDENGNLSVSCMECDMNNKDECFTRGKDISCINFTKPGIKRKYFIFKEKK